MRRELGIQLMIEHWHKIWGHLEARQQDVKDERHGTSGQPQIGTCSRHFNRFQFLQAWSKEKCGCLLQNPPLWGTGWWSWKTKTLKIVQGLWAPHTTGHIAGMELGSATLWWTEPRVQQQKPIWGNYTRKLRKNMDHWVDQLTIKQGSFERPVAWPSG